jgi:hypothetical protein
VAAACAGSVLDPAVLSTGVLPTVSTVSVSRLSQLPRLPVLSWLRRLSGCGQRPRRPRYLTTLRIALPRRQGYFVFDRRRNGHGNTIEVSLDNFTVCTATARPYPVHPPPAQPQTPLPSNTLLHSKSIPACRLYIRRCSTIYFRIHVRGEWRKEVAQWNC